MPILYFYLHWEAELSGCDVAQVYRYITLHVKQQEIIFI